MDFEPYKPPAHLAQESSESSESVVISTLRTVGVAGPLLWVVLFFVGIAASSTLLAVAAPVRHLFIAGLSCTRGWREAVHELSCIVSLYPHVMVVCIVLGLLRLPRTWLLDVAAVLLGFTTSLVWAASDGALPNGIESVHHPSGVWRVVVATVHGISHLFLIPIGYRAGEHLRVLKLPRLSKSDCVALAALFIVWTLTIIETNTSFQHTLLHWLTLLTLILLAGRTSRFPFYSIKNANGESVIQAQP